MRALKRLENYLKLKGASKLLYSLSKDFFNGEEDLINLNRVWYNSIDSHIFYQNDENDIDSTMESEWFNNLNDLDKSLYKDAVVNSMQMGARDVQVIIGETHTAFEANQFLSQPLKIILENSENDAHFMNAIFRCFKSESNNMLEKISQRVVVYDMGAGSCIEQKIRTELNGFNGAGFPKENHEYLRCLVVMDSDKKSPTDELKQGTLNIIELLEANNIVYHVLEKREMENYLPDEVFDDLPEQREFIEAYLRMKPSQKDYFDIENGFPDLNFDSFDDKIKELYTSLSKEDINTFRKIGLKDLFENVEGNFKNEFPKLFSSEKITKKNLMEKVSHQDDSDELKTLGKKVRELL